MYDDCDDDGTGHCRKCGEKIMRIDIEYGID
jgi:hypothetical protein